MNRLIAAPFAFLLGCGPAAPTVSLPDPQPPANPTPTAAPSPEPTDVLPGGDAGPAVSASNAFGFDLFERMPKGGNVAFSPASLSTALAMTFAGAKGNTAAQMASVLHVSDPAALHGGWATVLHGWQQVEAVEIAAANRLYGDQHYAFEPPFLSLTQSRYGAPLIPVDFAGDHEAQRKLINEWVETRTRDRIADLIPEGGVNGDTRMALVNALYFKAQWAEPFRKESTEDASFAASTGGVTVPMMSQTAPMKFAEVDGVTLAERNYEGGRFATLFVLPNATTGLAALERDLNAQTLARWSESLSTTRVWMKLPRFKLSPASVELSGRLVQLGMKDAFNPNAADFTGMTNPANPADQLFIQKVFHKAFVAMDEAGTEAAAASAVILGRKGASPGEPKQFHANRPFLFFIRDTATGLVLFAGRVADPTQT